LYEERESKKEETALSQKRPFADLIGTWKGDIWMADDFDEPLEEMREYME
jgi:hypothetical protein